MTHAWSRAVLAGAVALAACSSRPERVLIGVALTTGDHQAVQMAIEEINLAGGIDGVPVEAFGLEWNVAGAFEPHALMEWAGKFAAEPELLAIVGHSDSTSALAAAPLYATHGIPQVVTTASHPKVTRGNPFTFRICANDSQVGRALARYAVDDWNKRRIALFYVNDDYGRGLAEVFSNEVERRGGQLLASTYHRNRLTADDEQHIRSVLLRIRSQEPDLLVLLQRPDAGRWTIRTARELGMSTDALGGDSLSLPSTLADPATVEGLRSVEYMAPRGDTALPGVRDRVFAPNGRRAGYTAVIAYDAVMLLADAVRAGGFSRDGVQAALIALSAEGALRRGAAGDYRLNRERETDRSIYIVEARAGQHHYVATLPLSE